MNLEGITLSEISQTNTNTAWSHLHVESKIENLQKQRVEWWLPGAGGDGNGEMYVKGYKFSIIWRISSEDLMFSMVTIVNNTVLHTWKLLRVDLKCSHHLKRKKLPRWGDGCVNHLDLGNHSTMHMYSKIITLYTLNTYNYIRQLFSRKLGEKIIKIKRKKS